MASVYKDYQKNLYRIDAAEKAEGISLLCGGKFSVINPALAIGGWECVKTVRILVDGRPLENDRFRIASYEPDDLLIWLNTEVNPGSRIKIESE